MSAIKDEAERSYHELEQATSELASLRKKHAELESDLAQRQHDGKDTQDVAAKLFVIENSISEKDARAEKASQEFQAAMTNLAAEKKLEAELHQQLNKDKGPDIDLER